MSNPASPPNDKQALGRYGESLAVNFLDSQGYRIIERNYQSRRWGEIDIIAIERDTLAFIEVKTRVGSQMLEPYEAVHQRKLRAFKRAAYFYIQQNEENQAGFTLPQAYRLDFISVFLPSLKSKAEVELFRNIEEW
ncbi:YraN family protein [Patescibacteria group bacterium]|nr:YraN family protein [Patescibacteria group bacterium]MBU1868449.1 YraN family protein [Patescibacteria group bacterium]